MIDQYGNKTDCLNAESVKTLSVSADDLDKEALVVEWQVNTATGTNKWTFLSLKMTL